MGGGPVSAHGHDVLPGIGLCASLALAVALCLGFALSRAGRSGPRKIHSGKIHLAG